MKRSIVTLCVVGFLVACVLADSGEVYFRGAEFKGVPFDRHVVGANGNLKFFAASNIATFKNAITSDKIVNAFKHLLNLQGTEVFKGKRFEVDSQFNEHIMFQQYNRDLEVDGGELIIHMSANGQVFAVTSSVLPDLVDEEPKVTGSDSLTTAIARDDVLRFYADSITVDVEPELVYLLFNDEGILAYRSQISYVDHLDFNITKSSKLYVDAIRGTLLLNNPIFMTAKNREVYTAKTKTVLPGTLVRKEGQGASNDQEVNAAYDNSGICYDYFKQTFNRDSIDGKGAKLISTVHYDVRYNNAFWNGKQMVYGDGDGVNFANFAADLSVVCHELTHAVTEKTAGLRYQGESGALNEGMSDIFGASATIYKKGFNQYSWMIGHDCYLAGEALRYMNNPLLDGVSYDWYPTRYKGSQDNGGVHWNSGIANLAYVLMVQGGVHPQQKSSIWVEEIGIAQAQQIMYSALAHCMTSTSTFATARGCTETAAKNMYGEAVEQSVANAWTAVGVN